MWLSPVILEWESSVDAFVGAEAETWHRPYTLWSHAEHLLEQSTEILFRVDAITTLKRAMDHRIRLLDDIYEFRRIPIKGKPSGGLELLNYFGIVRPKMVQKLIDIRNAVEHQDADPPDKDHCFDFLEFSWYFLRSTDILVRRPLQNIALDPPENELDPNYYGVGIKLTPDDGWVPKLTAWVIPSMISPQPVDDWLSIKVEKTETREMLLSRMGNLTVPEEWGIKLNPEEWDFGRGKNPEDIYIRGEIRGPAHHLLRLYQKYFETV